MEYIRFLRKVTCPKSHSVGCGSGCCSWLEWEDEIFDWLDEVENNEYEIDISALELGVDYEIVEK